MRLSGQRQSFLRNNFEHTKAQFKQKSTNKTKRSEHKTTKETIFCAPKIFQKDENRLLCVLVLFGRLRSFRKKHKQTRSCPDKFIYYTTDNKPKWIILY